LGQFNPPERRHLDRLDEAPVATDHPLHDGLVEPEVVAVRDEPAVAADRLGNGAA